MKNTQIVRRTPTGQQPDHFYTPHLILHNLPTFSGVLFLNVDQEPLSP